MSTQGVDAFATRQRRWGTRTQDNSVVEWADRFALHVKPRRRVHRKRTFCRRHWLTTSGGWLVSEEIDRGLS